MASTNKTPNLELPQWELTDKPEMSDFNDAFDKIDTDITAHLADYESLNEEIILWSGYANTGSLTLSEDPKNFVGLAIETNSNPATSGFRGGIFIPCILTGLAHYPICYGTNITWIRVAIIGQTFAINSTGNENLHIIRIMGVGRRPNTGGE